MATLVTGASGTIGRRLLPSLERVVVTTRNRNRVSFSQANVAEIVEWDWATGPLLPPRESIDSVVHLMGEPIAARRWNAEHKRRVRESRVKGTANLVESILTWPRLPSVVIAGSAVGFYGEGGDSWLDESSPVGSGFLPTVCGEWEAAAEPLRAAGVRVVWLRTGLVLSPAGGMLKELLPVYRWGGGGVLGSGQQFMPWIHQDDLVGLIQWALQTSTVSGPVNGCGPEPVSQREFNRSLSRAVGRPAPWWVPGPLLRVLVGEFAESLLLSQRVRPRVALESGFHFRFPQLTGALANLLSR